MFKGKRVLITGGSSGLGLCLARSLHGRGARLALAARSRDKLEAAKQGIESANPQGETVRVFPCDVADQVSVREAFQAIRASAGAPQVLINSAGVLKEGRFTDLTPDVFRYVMDINFFGTLHCAKEVLPGMLERREGRILNICSVAGRMGVYGYAAYCASKHAVMGLTESLRCELAGSGVSVHIAYPPEFDSPMVDDLNTYRTPENKKMVQTIPVMDVDQVTRLILRGLEKNRYAIIPGLPSRAVCGFNRHFPGLAHRVAMSRIRK